MHTDARQLDNNTLIEGDICIIGAGAAGISIALELMNIRYKVILLEGGGFEYEDRVQELYRGEITGQPYYPIKSSELHYFGGTTGHWGGMCSLFDPIAFKKRSWVEKSGWPITQETLLPYYERGHGYLDIGRFEFDIDYWLKQDPTLKVLPFDKEVIWNKIWKFSGPTRFGTKFKDTIVNSANVHLYTYANVTDIVANNNITGIKEVIIKNYAGKTHRVTARHFVLACAGIQNPRVLLAANKQAPKGLGNDNDLVGRYFMEHLDVDAAELWLSQKDDLRLYLLAEHPRVQGDLIQGELAIMPEKQEEYKILNGIVSFIPADIGRKIPPFIESWSNSDPRENEKRVNEITEEVYGNKLNHFLNHFKSEKEKKLHRTFQITMRMEQSPNPLSRVTLSKEKDELGVPRASLHWDLTRFEKYSLKKIYEIIGQQAGASGIGRVKISEELADEKNDHVPKSTGGGWHHMGTTRMSDDPKSGVVDADCKIHGIQNLFIAGSSCFPTGAGVNPTYTIVALSIRLADHLKKQMELQSPPIS
ncbi:MAG TPA: GMC family oxidoreductase [Puia sp.]|nr:GMC family oxidoreductase [Puia sp.]